MIFGIVDSLVKIFELDWKGFLVNHFVQPCGIDCSTLGKKLCRVHCSLELFSLKHFFHDILEDCGTRAVPKQLHMSDVTYFN